MSFLFGPGSPTARKSAANTASLPWATTVAVIGCVLLPGGRVWEASVHVAVRVSRKNRRRDSSARTPLAPTDSRKMPLVPKPAPAYNSHKMMPQY